MVTLKNREIAPASDAIQKLAQEKLPTLLAVKVMRMSRVLLPQAEIVNDARNSVVKKYTKLDGEGKPVPVLDEEGNAVPRQVQLTDTDAFIREVSELFEGTLELECPTIYLDELNLKDKKGNPREFEPAILIGLGPLLVELVPVAQADPNDDSE